MNSSCLYGFRHLLCSNVFFIPEYNAGFVEVAHVNLNIMGIKKALTLHIIVTNDMYERNHIE